VGFFGLCHLLLIGHVPYPGDIVLTALFDKPANASLPEEARVRVGQARALFHEIDLLLSVTLQIKGSPFQFWETVDVEARGISVNLLGLHRGSACFQWIQNAGHLFSMDGMKFLHLGYADMDLQSFQSYQLAQARMDIAFLHFGFLLEKSGRDLVDHHIKPKHLIAVHIPPEDETVVVEKIRKYDPHSVCLLNLGAQHRFPSPTTN